jgi:hypothetical protein
MGMLMILREDRRSKFGESFEGIKNQKPANPKSKDPFFERNYGKGSKPALARQGFNIPSTQELIEWQ